MPNRCGSSPPRKIRRRSAPSRRCCAAFADTFPVLTQVKDATVESIRDEGDTPFVELALTDTSGNAYRATIGFWLDDAGDWKVISCDIAPAADRLG